MRYRMERFVLLPFSVGCISESSVAIGHQQHKSSSLHQSNLIPTRSLEEEKEDEEDDEKNLEGENLKNSLALPKFQRLFKNFKNLSHIFVDKDQMEEEEEEMGMEIGLPTDVKHVTHIGIDGDEATSLILNSTRTNWDYLNLNAPNHDLLTQFSSNFPFANMANHSPNHTSMATSS
ncbi:CRIB domain-containing protein RIC4-like [Solanum dulcamara]|uniref:CRIB domain-containing protein RIC4-like n=1 Tax=Solanum dulcamara TaxID=45834 RepID=UPI0024853EBC|nr:CRIB domain-containing protein RIC4-like [Solanum dulcamara]